MQQTKIISLFLVLLFLLGVISVPVLAQLTTETDFKSDYKRPRIITASALAQPAANTFEIYLYSTKVGNKQHRYALDVTPQGGTPEVYNFTVTKYERSYKYAGEIRWKHYKTFPHGEGKIVDMPGTGRMNITGWLGANVLQGKFFGLMSDLTIPGNATKYWVIAKEMNPRQAFYGTYLVNKTT